jgi:hypothetical protein
MNEFFASAPDRKNRIASDPGALQTSRRKSSLPNAPPDAFLQNANENDVVEKAPYMNLVIS